MTNSSVNGFEESGHVLVRSAPKYTGTREVSGFEKFSLICQPSKSVQPLAASLGMWERQRDRYLETLAPDKPHP